MHTIYIMSTPLYECTHCGKNSFKSQRGLTQHQKTSAICSSRARQKRDQDTGYFTAQEGILYTRVCQPINNKRANHTTESSETHHNIRPRLYVNLWLVFVLLLTIVCAVPKIFVYILTRSAKLFDSNRQKKLSEFVYHASRVGWWMSQFSGKTVPYLIGNSWLDNVYKMTRKLLTGSTYRQIFIGVMS